MQILKSTFIFHNIINQSRQSVSNAVLIRVPHRPDSEIIGKSFLLDQFCTGLIDYHVFKA